MDWYTSCVYWFGNHIGLGTLTVHEVDEGAEGRISVMQELNSNFEINFFKT